MTLNINEGLCIIDTNDGNSHLDIIVREIRQNPKRRKDLSVRIEVVEGEFSDSYWLHHGSGVNVGVPTKEYVRVSKSPTRIRIDKDKINENDVLNKYVSLRIDAIKETRWHSVKYGIDNPEI
jgi:hypothetical protein